MFIVMKVNGRSCRAALLHYYSTGLLTPAEGIVCVMQAIYGPNGRDLRVKGMKTVKLTSYVYTSMFDELTHQGLIDGSDPDSVVLLTDRGKRLLRRYARRFGSLFND